MMIQDQQEVIRGSLNTLLLTARPDVMSSIGFITLSELIENKFQFTHSDIEKKFEVIERTFLINDKRCKEIKNALKEIHSIVLRPQYNRNNIYQTNHNSITDFIVCYWEESQMCLSTNTDLLLPLKK